MTRLCRTPALLRSAAAEAGEPLTLAEIFRRAEGGDTAMSEVVENYTLMLGQGIVNIVNLFRPQLVLLGGELSAYADQLGSHAGLIGAANL